MPRSPPARRLHRSAASRSAWPELSARWRPKRREPSGHRRRTLRPAVQSRDCSCDCVCVCAGSHSLLPAAKEKELKPSLTKPQRYEADLLSLSSNSTGQGLCQMFTRVSCTLVKRTSFCENWFCLCAACFVWIPAIFGAPKRKLEELPAGKKPAQVNQSTGQSSISFLVVWLPLCVCACVHLRMLMFVCVYTVTHIAVDAHTFSRPGFTFLFVRVLCVSAIFPLTRMLKYSFK